MWEIAGVGARTKPKNHIENFVQSWYAGTQDVDRSVATSFRATCGGVARTMFRGQCSEDNVKRYVRHVDTVRLFAGWSEEETALQVRV